MKFNVLQYLPQNTKIRVNERLRKELFYKKTVTEWSKTLKVHLKNMSRYMNGKRPIPIKVLIELINFKKININSLQNEIEIKIDKGGKYLKIGPFIEINEQWVYVSELINGDGHITPDFWCICFINNNKILIRYVKNFFLSLGIKLPQMYLVKRDDANFLTIRSSLLAHILNKILDVAVGKKNEINIPEFIISDKNLSIAAVRGAFDAEGSVTFTGSRRISISSNSRQWVLQLKRILESLRISSTIIEEKSKREKPIYRLLIYSKTNLVRFRDTIRPLHSKRIKKLNEIINNYTRNPSRWLHKKVLLSIKNGNERKRDIAKNLNQKLVITGSNINWLKKKEYIEPYQKIYTNKGSFHKYKLTQQGEEYLNKSLSFFD